MRKFYFINQKGDVRALNGEDKIFLVKPEGLGSDQSNSYGEINRKGFFTVLKVFEKQGNFTGELVCTGKKAYDNAFELFNWIEGSEELYVIYQPSGNRFYRKLDPKNIVKSEKSAGGFLHIGFGFPTLTPWFEKKDYRVNAATQLLSGSPYFNSFELEFTAGSSMVSPVISTMRGNNVAGQCSLPGITVAAGSVLRYCNHPDKCGISVDGVDMVGSMDASLAPFATTTGEFSVVLSATAAVSGALYLSHREYWRLV